MTSKFLRVLLAIAVTFAISALAQTGSAATPSNSAATSGSSLPSAPSATTSGGPGTKVGTINITEAIFGSNEGQRDVQALQKKFEPKQTELKSQNDELESLKKQLTTQEGKLNDDALATLKKQIESKQKVFDRAVQDAQEDFGNQQQEIATRVLQKMAPMIVKYSQDNGFGMIVDTSKPWPQSNVLWWGEASDITKAVVDTYNVQSGVPAPAAPATGAAKPAAPKPSGTGAAKPAAPKPTDPSK
jgi:outer membrane protein